MTTQPQWVPKDSLAHRVRWLREELGLTQREAAVKCGLTFGEWQGLEMGRDARGIDRKLKAISLGFTVDGMPVSLDWLLWGEIPQNRVELSREHESPGEARFSGSDVNELCEPISAPEMKLRLPRQVAAVA